MIDGNYEIQVKSGSRWSLHSVLNNEDQAIVEGRNLLKQKIVEAVKITCNLTEPPEVIFDETEDSFKKKAALSMIDTSPLMVKLEDLFTPASTETLSALLRDYCDQKFHSATELLHNHLYLQHFQNTSLFGSAINHLATLQAAKAQQSEQQRRDDLFRLFKEAEDKARGSGFDDIRKGTLDEYLANAGDLEDPTVSYRVTLSLTNQTMRATSWESKFGLIDELFGREIEEKNYSENTIAFLDRLYSEYLSYPNAVVEILGQQPDRYNAIMVLTKMCTGSYEARKWDTLALTHLSKLMSLYPMSKCRKQLADRIESMLRNRSALTKGDMYEEKHAFKELFPLFIARNGNILGGEGMSEALTMSGARSFNRDRTLDKPNEAINFIVEKLAAPILQLRYLLTLANSRMGKDSADIICAFIPEFMSGPEHIHDIVHYKLPLKRKLKVITNLQKSALKTKLPNNMQQKLVDWLDELLFDFLNEEKIVDKMDSPQESLYVRATQLLQFCASGLLIEGKTLSWVRERVQEHLRQPNFVEKFTEDIQTTKKKELVITQLHAMLKKAGLQQ